MKVVLPGEKAPSSYTSSVFLAGPTPRSEDVDSWRPEALAILEEKGYDGVVFVPEPFDKKGGYESQVEWEDKHLNMADCILFWIPRSEDLPGYTTNVEFGEWFKSGKIVIGFPEEAQKVRYLESKAIENSIPVNNTLEDTVDSALSMLGKGSLREDGERNVPLFIWKTKSFQSWYKAQKNAGNRLDGAKLLWNFRVGKNKENVFSWVLHVDVFIKDEGRNKINEFVFSRPDIACVVVACPNTTDISKTKVIIIREFRSPAANEDCFVREIPGGSSKDTTKEMAKVIAAELKEEAGIELDPKDFQYIQSRQICSTLSSHKAHLFAVAISERDIEKLDLDTSHGVAEDSEVTYVEVWDMEGVLASDLIDWSMLGMITKGVASIKNPKDDEDWVGGFLG